MSKELNLLRRLRHAISDFKGHGMPGFTNRAEAYILLHELDTLLSEPNKPNPMIEIERSPTADTRTCDFANVTPETLVSSSLKHIDDVRQGLLLFMRMLSDASAIHDYDKLSKADWFHADFITGFKQTGWWDNHRKIHRHHLAQEDGVRDDVNLLDVLEYITDCVMAGMARSGQVETVQISDELLREAFVNTVELLKSQIKIKLEPPVEKKLGLGYCPKCGAPGKIREKRPYGNDECFNGHTYPSADAIPTSKG